MSLVALAALLLMLVYAPRGRMAQAVQAFGFRDVRISGIAWLGCGDGDVFRRKWSAHRPDGAPVAGVVCGGLTKGWTVRITGGG